MATDSHIHVHVDGWSTAVVRSIRKSLDHMEARLMSAFDDLAAKLVAVNTRIDNVAADIAALKSALAVFSDSGATPEQVALIQADVDNILARLTVVDESTP